MEPTSTDNGKRSDPRDQPKNLGASPLPKKGKSKNAGMRYVRFETEDGSIIEGLMHERSSESGGDLKFNQCYFVKDIGRVGRLSVDREAGAKDDLPVDLPSFEHVEDAEDNVKIPSAPILSAEQLRKWYPLKRGFFETLVSGQEMNVKAVDGISFTVKKGEIMALAGESGSGKTTVGKLLLRLIKPTDGSIYFQGKDITRLKDSEFKPLRKEIQIVFQDPFESLDPRQTIKDIIAEPLVVQHLSKSEEEVEERVKAILQEVQLVPPEEFLYRFPHELSGGQRQRVAVARAFILNPSFVVADEPVSMLDVSIRADILNLMVDLVKKTFASIIYITHDIALAKHVCDRIAVMYLGKLMETASSQDVVDKPLHPYTQALVAAVPVPDPDSKRTTDVISGEIPSPVDPPSGCRFHTRCPYAHQRCVDEEPGLVEVEKEHYVACHLYT